jgi:hypothetical protein
MQCGLAPQRHFRAIHLVDARFSAGRATRWNYRVAGEESKLHQATGDIFWKIEPVKDSGLARF